MNIIDPFLMPYLVSLGGRSGEPFVLIESSPNLGRNLSLLPRNRKQRKNPMIILQEIFREKPDAVFIWRTNMESLEEYTPDRLCALGEKVAGDIFRNGNGSPDVPESFIIKPNIGGGPRAGEDPSTYLPQPGESTNVDIVRGLIQVLQSLEVPGDRITVTEGRSNLDLEPTFQNSGYARMTAEAGVHLINNSRDPYAPEELNWVPLEQGVVTKEMPLVRPVNDPGTQLINIATMKAHGLVIATLCVKNLQGLVAYKYKHFCSSLEGLEKYDPEVRAHFHDHLRETLERGRQRHQAEDPEWDLVDEIYANRACDSLLAIHPLISIVEGVLARTGTGYRRGQDVLANTIVAGVNPVHVDAVTTFLMGHNPDKPNYLRMARERGFGTNKPEEVETYLWTDDGPVLCEDLKELDRLSIGVFRRGDDSEAVLV